MSGSRECVLVLDLEATCCDDSSMARAEMEIIEIGAVMVERATLCTLDEFQAFIRPVRHPRLTDFCTRLTSIQQGDADAAAGYPAVTQAFNAWIHRPHVQLGRASCQAIVSPYLKLSGEN